MTDYTPTTEDVRSYYTVGRDEADGEIDRSATVWEFYRWLQEIRDEAYGRGYDDGWKEGYYDGAGGSVDW